MAHRGGAAEFPENSMVAFQNAISLGYRYLETDVRVTRDGRLVAFHDERTDRVTDQPGPLAERTWDEVRRLRLRDAEGSITDERIPLLEELLAAFPDARLNIDAKESRALAPLVELILRTRSIDRVCLAAFSEDRLAKLRAALGAELCTACGPRDIAKVRLRSLARLLGKRGRPAGDCLQVPIRQPLLGPLKAHIVDRRFLAAAAQFDLPVLVWTVNDDAEMTRLLDLGVAGLLTDRPSALKEVLLARDQFPGGQ